MQTSASTIQALFDLQLAHYSTVGSSSWKERRTKLRAIEKWLLSNRDAIREALQNDFAKPTFETDFSDTFMAIQEARHARKHIKRWMRDEPVRTPLAMTGTRAWIKRESKGVCLIMSPWNFPINLAVGPLVSAVAAGNCVILKPSERTPHSTALLQRMVSELFGPEEVAVVVGAKAEGQALLKLPFHHIFFTGSVEVGKAVMRAAAENLSSITLELGGKSPAVVDASANLKQAAERIAWGTFFNAGQTCVAPDYVLVHADVHAAFSEKLRAALAAYYPNDTATDPNYGQVVDTQHAADLMGMSGANVTAQGAHVPPTIVDSPDLQSDVMQREIFGPILPVCTFTTFEEALEIIGERDRPLALYVFSKNRTFTRNLINQTRAGSSGINVTVGPFGHRELPFGGINHSGIGKAHGRWGFEEFTNQRSMLRSNLPVNYHFLVKPPYNAWKRRALELIMRWL